MDDNFYLVCPFNQHYREAILRGAWKRRKEAIRKLREAGHKFLESADFPDAATQWAFQQYWWEQMHLPFSRQELQEGLVYYYGWEKWVDDPWGNSDRFYEWINTTKDNALAAWAINETPGGRFYLATNILYNLTQIDYSSWSPEELHFAVGSGSQYFLGLRWEEFNYPREPLPTRFVNEQIIKVSPERPLFDYRYTIGSIFGASFLTNEYDKRLIKHPEVVGLLDYAIATNPLSAEWPAFAPNGYRFLDEDESWGMFEKSSLPGSYRCGAVLLS